MSDTKTRTSGVGFGGLLTIVFIVLRLTNYIDWPWYWVLSPVLIPLGIIAILLIIAGLVAVSKK